MLLWIINKHVRYSLHDKDVNSIHWYEHYSLPPATVILYDYAISSLKCQWALLHLLYDFSTLTKLLFRHILSEMHKKNHKNELSVTINSTFRHSHTPAYQNQGQHWEDVVHRVTEERPPGQSDGLWSRNGGKSWEL